MELNDIFLFYIFLLYFLNISYIFLILHYEETAPSLYSEYVKQAGKIISPATIASNASTPISPAIPNPLGIRKKLSLLNPNGNPMIIQYTKYHF